MWKYLNGILRLQFKRKIEWYCSIKIDSTTVILFCIKFGPSHSNVFICFNESLSEMMKSAFYLILKALFVIKIFEFSERFNKNFLWKFSICFTSILSQWLQLVSYWFLLWCYYSFSSKNSSYIWKKQKLLANSKAYCCSNPVVSTTT